MTAREIPKYTQISLASLDFFEKYVLLCQAAELDEVNGAGMALDSDPKPPEASTVKALQFLAGSHLAWKPLEGTVQKEKQPEAARPSRI